MGGELVWNGLSGEEDGRCRTWYDAPWYVPYMSIPAVAGVGEKDSGSQADSGYLSVQMSIKPPGIVSRKIRAARRAY